MDDVRAVIDSYEEIASREFYKLPLYEDMLFNL
jgi:glutamine synthetase